MRRFGTALLIGVIALSACSDDPPDFEVADPIGNAEPGDVIALRANGGAVEYVSRRTGEIRSFDTATDATQILATIGVSTDGEQRGLLGHTVIDDRRFAAWTDPDTFDLVVGEVTSGSVDRMIWSGTGTQSKAVGGHLDTIDGKILLGIGSLTDWANDHGSGAMVTLDPDGNEGQSPVVLSDGWNNPFAFTVLDDGTIWVADNAPDGSDLPVAERDGERIATTDATGPSLLEPPPSGPRPPSLNCPTADSASADSSTTRCAPTPSPTTATSNGQARSAPASPAPPCWPTAPSSPPQPMTTATPRS